MTDAEEPLLAAQADPEKTIVAPRFDETEAQTAQPVVPLARAPRFRRRPRLRPLLRLWPLLLLSAVLGGALSVFGLHLYQQRRAHALAPAPASQPAARNAQPASVPGAQPVTNEPPTPAPPSAASETPAPASIAETAQPHTQPSRPDTPVRTTAQAKVERAPADSKREATKHAPPRRDPQAEAAAQPARVNDGAVRPRLVDVLHGDNGDDRDDNDREMRRRAWRHWRREHPPEQDAPQRDHAPRQQPRGADRIRDIFEGSRPPV